MVPNEYSARIARGVLRMYRASLPLLLRPLFTNIFIYLVGDDVRDAFMLKLDTGIHSPVIGLITVHIFPLVLKIRAKLIRHCMLPRTRPPVAFTPAKDGIHTHVAIKQVMPYYVRATWWNTWGPVALYRRALGLPIPGKEYISQGYKLEEIGFSGKGGDKVLEIVDQAKRGGCPFSTFGRVEDEHSLGGVYAKFNAPGHCSKNTSF